MSPLLMFLLVVLALILATNRRQVGVARSWTEIWAPARANGWKRCTGLAVVGLLVFACKFLGSLALVVITPATKALQGVAFVASVVQAHLKDLLNPSIPIVRAEAA